MRFIFFVGLGLPASALAVPTQLGHQGRVLDADGLPSEGLHSLEFRMYDADVDGTMVWSEIHDVDLINGYYSLVLGADELDNPLDDDLLRDHSLHLELTVDEDDPLSPRQALNAVPYARLSDSATNVVGGVVDASEIRVGGLTVVDGAGDWVGSTPSMDWSDLTGIPSGLADAEDSDTMLTEEEVDAFCSDNGYAIAADLAAIASSGSFSDLSDVPEDIDTQLSEDEVDAFCADNGYAMATDMAPVASSGSFSDLSDVPEDVDTQLSEDEVDAFCADNGYAVAADLAAIASSGSYDDLAGVPAVVGVSVARFSESGTFTVPDGITSLTVYVAGGGGGGSNGEFTALDLGSHSHAVGSHSHSGGSHNHDSGTHSHSASAGSSTSYDPCASTSSCGGCIGGYVTSGGGTTTTGAATGITGDAEISTGAAGLTTEGSDSSDAVVTHNGGDGGSGGGISALLSVTPGTECTIRIGDGGVVGAAGTSSSVYCGDASVECDGGASGLDNGTFGRDGGCAVDGGGILSEYKPSHFAPGGGGAGGQVDAATPGSSGSIAIRY
jgi:hypothetical protein